MPYYEGAGDNNGFYKRRAKLRESYERKLIAKGVKPRSSKMLELMCRKFK